MEPLAGEFNKESAEFLEVADKARTLTQIHANNATVAHYDAGGGVDMSNVEEVPQTPANALKSRF